MNSPFEQGREAARHEIDADGNEEAKCPYPHSMVEDSYYTLWQRGYWQEINYAMGYSNDSPDGS